MALGGCDIVYLKLYELENLVMVAFIQYNYNNKVANVEAAFLKYDF